MACGDKDIIGWITKGGKRIPLYKSKLKKTPIQGKKIRTDSKPLSYDQKAADSFKKAGFDVASPEETAKAFGRKVKK